MFTGVCGQLPRIGWQVASRTFFRPRLLLMSHELLRTQVDPVRAVVDEQPTADHLLHAVRK